jgi:uncharacterized protein YciI
MLGRVHRKQVNALKREHKKQITHLDKTIRLLVVGKRDEVIAHGNARIKRLELELLNAKQAQAPQDAKQVQAPQVRRVRPTGRISPWGKLFTYLARH